MKAVQIRPLMPTDEPELMKQLGQLPCGFPSPGLDHEEPPLSLDELVGMRALRCSWVGLLATACAAEPKQMIACTRSFSERVTDFHGLRTAISTFVANASRKLREQRQYAACIQVFIRTSPFDTTGMQYGRSISVPLPCPTYDTRDLLGAAVAGLRQIYIEGPRYAKAGVILSQFFDAGMFTDDLFAQPARKNTEKLMAVLDRINMTHERGSVRFASEPAVASWHMKQQLLSPQYTTRWTDVMRVNA